MHFHYPSLLALLLMLPLVWRFAAGATWRLSAWLRMGLFVAMVLALAQPYWRLPSPGTDLIVLVDRSASCGTEAGTLAAELLDLIHRGEGIGDRTAVVGFADGARVEQPFSVDPSAPVAEQDLPPYASDLAAGLRVAAQLRDPARRTAVLCLSDGRYTGAPPADGPVLAELGATPVWYRNLDRFRGPDAAAVGIHVPEGVAARSAWIVRYTIHSNVPQTVAYTLSRAGLVLSRGRVDCAKGDNVFFARDTADTPGMIAYRLEIDADPDAVPGNDVAVAALRVEGAPRALLVSTAEAPGLLARALEAASIPVDRRTPHAFPDAPALLAPYKLVILENCRLTDLPSGGAAALARAVDHGLAALWVAGGENSFGSGGYHRSVIDPFLPVEMELRNEKRRGALALAVALDRSGSMAVAASGNAMASSGERTKMDVANLGVAESIRLLSPADQIAVFAVDTSAHVIVPLTQADDVASLAGVVSRIQSMGGGIYCLTALKAAAAELDKSKIPARHLVLFADASDAEEQEGCIEFVKELLARGIGLSVIGMGSRTDADAGFLRDLAIAGGGEALFSDRMDELPSLFTQEVIRVSQRGFVKDTLELKALPALSGLGVPAGMALPSVDGYNVASLREGATAFMLVADDYDTPALAFRAKGRAVAGASLFEIDGAYAGGMARWSRAPELLTAFARRLAGGVRRADLKGYGSLAYGVGALRVEFSPELARKWRGRPLSAEWLAPDGEGLRSPLVWTGPGVAVATQTLVRPGHYLPTVNLGEDGLLTASPVSVSYSGEFAPRAEFSGAATLAALAEATDGGEGLDLDGVRRSARASRSGQTPLAGPLLLLALALFLLELAGRRFSWFG